MLPPSAVTSTPAARGNILLIVVGIGLLILLATCLIYLPGLAGPFIFDDSYNIVTNTYVHLRDLNLHHLLTAAFSTDTGPLKRPISMLSFALNYYAIGGVNNAAAFKAVNIAIHAFNGLLVYWFCYLIFVRSSTLNDKNQAVSSPNTRALHLAAGASAVVWVVHPIQLTSVLYVVQRMTSLAAMFTLLGLIGYLTGRLRIEDGKRYGTSLIAFSIVLGGALASLSKETGLLLPIFVLLIEATLFRTCAPWARWHDLSSHLRKILSAILAIAALAVTVWVLHFASQGYAARPFTLIERGLTETRVLWMYLSLILLPSLDRFGLNHDDIPISSSLLHPWTTLPSLVGIVALVTLGLYFRKRQPLLSLGILWFFVGHSLESTIFGLEIAHEHRNYLPSLGIVLTVVYGVQTLAARRNRWQPWLIVPAAALVFGALTMLRSAEWSDLYTLATFEVLHHPRSSRAQAYLGQALAERKEYEGAARAYRRAAELNPAEASNLMILAQIPPSTGFSITPDEQRQVIRLLTSKRISPSSLLTLHGLNGCIMEQCAYAQRTVEQWIEALLKADIRGQGDSYYYYVLGRCLWGQGRFKEAFSAFTQSYTLDPKYLHPRIDAVKLLLAEGQLRKAQKEMSALVAANKNNRFPRDAEVAALSAIFDDLHQRKLLSN